MSEGVDISGTIGLLYTGGYKPRRSFKIKINPTLTIIAPGRTLMVDGYVDKKHIGNENWQYKNPYQAFYGHLIELSKEGISKGNFHRAGALVNYLHDLIGISQSDARKIVRKFLYLDFGRINLEGKCRNGNFLAIVSPKSRELDTVKLELEKPLH